MTYLHNKIAILHFVQSYSIGYGLKFDRLYSKIATCVSFIAVQLEMEANLTYLYSKIGILHSYSAVQFETAANLTYLHSKIAILRSYNAV